MTTDALLEDTAITSRIRELVPAARLHKLDTACGDRQVIVWGPPGTGKTTALMDVLDAHLHFGAPSENIMVATFTRNARAEVRNRLATKFGLLEAELPWVRTIHSSAYRLLELSPEKVMGPRSLEAFGKETEYEMKGQLAQRSVDDPFGTQSVETFGDWCHVSEELRRAKLLTFKQAEDTFRPPEVAAGWDAQAAEEFSRTYARWKKNNYLVDFSDMLEQIVEEELRPDVRWMFVDEAQDLTPLQWKVIDAWSKDITRQFVFGDDDQAIFAWAGADPKALWSRPGHQLVLSHSYRLLENVHREATRLIKRTRERVKKEFEPHGPGGDLTEAWAWEEVDYDKEGTWLLLGRNRAFLEECRAQLREQGVPFTDRTSSAGLPDPTSGRGRAIKALFDLQAGNLINKRSLIRHLRDQVKDDLWPEDRIGPKALWSLVDLLDAGATSKLVEMITTDPLETLKGTVTDKLYYRRVLKRYGLDGLTTKAPREIATIHGVKGEEADHVVVSTAMTRRTHDDYAMDPDPEHRVFFVAATRAKRSLTWLKGGSRTYYEI